MTISKDYGLLAQSGGTLKGELLTEGPHGPINPEDYKGWMEIK